MTDRYSKLAECMDCTPESVSKLIQQHAPWNGKAVCDDALRERAAVVAWLRKQRAFGSDALLGHGFATVCGILSDAIERGEHRREEEK